MRILVATQADHAIGKRLNAGLQSAIPCCSEIRGETISDLTYKRAECARHGPSSALRHLL